MFCRAMISRFTVAAAIALTAITATRADPSPGRAPGEEKVGEGLAVWTEQGKATASGEAFDPDGLTAGHRSLPFGTRVRVVNQENGRSVVVRINDRGPAQSKFIIDLARGSARKLGITGVAHVKLYKILDETPSAEQIPAPKGADKAEEVHHHAHSRFADAEHDADPVTTGTVNRKEEVPKAPASKEQRSHHLVIQVDQRDAAVMNQALNNAENLIDYYRGRGEDAQIEIIACGPGLHMLRSDTSPVKIRITILQAHFQNLTFTACANTKELQSKEEGREIELVPEARVVPNGAGRIVELQEQGWSYLRP